MAGELAVTEPAICELPPVGSGEKGLAVMGEVGIMVARGDVVGFCVFDAVADPLGEGERPGDPVRLESESAEREWAPGVLGNVPDVPAVRIASTALHCVFITSGRCRKEMV